MTFLFCPAAKDYAKTQEQLLGLKRFIDAVDTKHDAKHERVANAAKTSASGSSENKCRKCE